MHRRWLDLDRLRIRVMHGDDQVAIVGIGAILPDAPDRAALWRNVLAARCAIRPVPPQIWQEQVFYDPQHRDARKSHSRLGGVVGHFEFNPRYFNLPPALDVELDLTQKAALIAAREALAEIGIHGPTEGVDAAVIIGNAMGGVQARSERVLAISHLALEATIDGMPSFQSLDPVARARFFSELRQRWLAQFRPVTSNSIPGTLANIMAARVARFFNFNGPAHTVDAACASSLAAIEVATLGLLTHRYDLAVAGGVDFFMDPAAYAGFSAMSALSDVGSYPFDARASGFVMAEGAVLLALQRLSDARRQNNHVYAIIAGIGSSSDEHGGSLVAPSYKGQLRALRRAYTDAQTSPQNLGYVEAHGTATPVGDPIEVLSMRSAFADCPQGSIAIGSIKANIGHLKAGAGAAGLLRAVLAMEMQIIPPQANFCEPNPRCKFPIAPVRIPTEPEDWPKGRTHAGVSAFGFGGINYHVVLRRSECNRNPRLNAAASRLSGGAPKPTLLDHGVIAFGADSRDELLHTARTLSEQVGNRSMLAAMLSAAMGDVGSFPFRAALYAPDPNQAHELLDGLIAGVGRSLSPARLRNVGIFYAEGPVTPRRALAFMFTGQGSQYLGMLAQLRTQFAVIDETLREADRILHSQFPQPLSSYFAPSQGQADDADRFEQLSRTEVLQPAIVACNEALRRALALFVEPGLVFGHSLGECSAAIAAGVLSFEAGLRFAAERGRILSAASGGEPGSLLQVAASVEQVAAVVAGMAGQVVIANKNCPRQTVLGGGAAAIGDAERLLCSQGRQCSILPVSQAFHTGLMAPAVNPLREYLQHVDLGAPQIPMISSVTGGLVPPDAAAPGWFRDALARQVAAPVEYIAAVNCAYEVGARMFVEVGPKQALCGFVGDILRTVDKEVMPACHPKIGETATFGRALAAMATAGLIPSTVSDTVRSVRLPVAVRPPYVAGLDALTQSERTVIQSSEMVVPVAVNQRAADTQSAPAPPAHIVSAGSVQQRILDLLAQKTGYDREEINLDVALESDLGIDSITQLEIVAELQKTLNLQRDDTFRIADHPTLRHLIAYVESQRVPVSAQDGAAAAPESVQAAEDSLAAPFFCRRLVYETCSAQGAEIELGHVLVLHRDVPHTLAERTGWRSFVVRDESAAEIAAFGAAGVDTLIVMEEAPDLVGQTPRAATQAAVRRVARLGAALLASRLACKHFIVAIGGGPAQDGDGQASWMGAALAAWKSVYREWCDVSNGGGPGQFRILEIEGAFDAHADLLVSTLRRQGPAQIKLTNCGQVMTPVLRRVPFDPERRVERPRVVVVTGGARGIMARISRTLFATSGCKLVLVGRTPLLADAPGFDAVRARAAARGILGATASTQAVNTHVEEQRRCSEVGETLRELKAAGADVLYVQADVGVEGEITRVLAEARARFGHADWLVHGAGSENSKSMQVKSDADLEAVLRPKVTLLHELSRATDAPWLIVVSSIATRFGNAGQFEYAAANEALARFALARNGLVLDFGPWSETGMAARMEQVLRARGIDVLECASAARAAVDLMNRHSVGEYALSGRLGHGSDDWIGHNARVEFDVPGTECLVCTDLHLEDNAWLRDHRWQGVGLVPAVVSLAALSKAALMIEPQLPVCAVENLELLRPILVRPDRPATVQFRAERSPPCADGVRIEAQVVLAGRCVQRATLVLGTAADRDLPTWTAAGESKRSIQHDNIYALLFHGKSMRVLESVRVEGTRALGVSVPLGGPLGEGMPTLHRTAALAREVALQTAGVYLANEHGQAGLPDGIDRLTVFATPHSDETVHASVECVDHGDAMTIFDVILTGHGGRRLERLEKLRLRRTSTAVHIPVEAVAESTSTCT
jgi:acyl transferase domain-containing protein/NAD(P)-dependent dehydrogenase (short-subunit alcohol dehydrogenase family)